MSEVTKETVRFNLHLSAESYAALERLSQLCGHETIGETLRAAMKLYGLEEADGIVFLSPAPSDGAEAANHER